jgi:hypothetical protein
MKKYAVFTVILLAVLAMAVIPETTDAQARRKPIKARVIKHNNIRVIRAHPRVVRRAHIRYAHLPKWGSVVTVLPNGAVVIKSRAHPYYFHNGVYYMRQNNRYTVVRPGAGIRIRVLPVGYRHVIIGPRHYYYYYWTFYSKIDNVEEYEVVDAPEGAIVDALPDGYDVKTINGTEYYVLDGVKYAEVDAEDIDGGVGYEVMKL